MQRKTRTLLSLEIVLTRSASSLPWSSLSEFDSPEERERVSLDSLNLKSFSLWLCFLKHCLISLVLHRSDSKPSTCQTDRLGRKKNCVCSPGIFRWFLSICLEFDRLAFQTMYNDYSPQTYAQRRSLCGSRGKWMKLAIRAVFNPVGYMHLVFDRLHVDRSDCIPLQFLGHLKSLLLIE